MKIVHDDGRTMRLYGRVLGLGWLAGLCLLVGAGGYLLWAALQGAIVKGPWWMAIGPALGLSFVGLIALTGASLALQRESLELDRAAGEGRYRNWHRFLTRGKTTEFKLGSVHSVSVEHVSEARPGRRGFAVTVCRARVRLDKPRRAFTLDESRNGNDARVRAVGERVAAFLNVGVESVGSPDGEPPAVRKRKRRGPS